MTSPVGRERQASQDDCFHEVALRDVDFDRIILFAESEKNRDSGVNVALFEKALNKGFTDLFLRVLPDGAKCKQHPV